MAQMKQFSSDVPFENPLEGVAVQLDGQVFECKGRLSVLQLSKLASQAITDGMAEAAEAATIYKTFSLAFGSEYARLEAHIEERNTPDETILGVLQYLNEAVQENIERIAGRPTRPSSSSPTGLEGKEDLPVRSISLSQGTVAVGDQEPAKPAAGEPAAGSPTVRRTG